MRTKSPGDGKPTRYCVSSTAAAGFTLVELVLVITLIGILATVAVPRFFASTAFDERGYRDELSAALRYAQKVAIASGCPVQVSIAAAGYTLGRQNALAGHCDPGDNVFANPVQMSDGQAFNGATPANVVVSPAIDIRFGADGATNLAADLTISVGSQSVRVSALSGFVTAL